MKTDGRSYFGAILLFLAGIGTVMMGCASAPSPAPAPAPQPQPPSQFERDSEVEPREMPEIPIEAAHALQDSLTSIGLLHLPAMPQPEQLWRIPSPDADRTGAPSVFSRGPEPSLPPAIQDGPEIVLQPPPPVSSRVSLSSSLPALSSLEDPATVDPSSMPAAGVAAESVPADGVPDRVVGTRPFTEDDSPGRESSSIVSPPESPAERSPSASSRLAVPENTAGERTVNPGDRFQVSLPGQTWVYLGGGGELQFLDRAAENGSVVFSFRGPSIRGETSEPVTLEFESQDLATGRRTLHEEQILIADGSDGEEPQDARPSEDAPSVTEQSGAGVGGSTAVGGIPDDLEGAPYQELLQRVDELQSSGNHQAAVTLLEEMRHDGFGHDDQITFRLAQLYEAEWRGRDLRFARGLYQSVVDNYPLSRWRRPARERIEYLNRHFFHIR